MRPPKLSQTSFARSVFSCARNSARTSSSLRLLSVPVTDTSIARPLLSHAKRLQSEALFLHGSIVVKPVERKHGPAMTRQILGFDDACRPDVLHLLKITVADAAHQGVLSVVFDLRVGVIRFPDPQHRSRVL